MLLALEIALIIVSVLLIVLVLLHKGRGGGLSDMFGGGISSTMGGSSVAERNLNRITLMLAILWVILIVATGLQLA
jgi:preprotein translocase subunit SecG